MPQFGGGGGDDLARFYTVTDPRRHDKGHTVYKVTARIVSRKNPEKVEEIVVWKRYNDIKKLHKELCMIHRNLFRRSEEFPPFAKATVFGRFEDSVIEERRQCAEDLLQFSANIPSLYNSQQLQEFFEGGDKHEGSDIIGPADSPTDSFSDSLHQGPEDRLQDKVPLSSRAREDGGERDDETESVDTLPDLPDILLTSPGLGTASGTGSGCSGLDVCGSATGGGVSEAAADILLPNLPASAGEMEPPAASCPPPLSPDSTAGADHADDWVDGTGAGRPTMGRQDSLFSLSTAGRGKDDYLVVASQQIHLALAQEVLGNYQGAFDAYKMGVDLLLQGVQGDTNTVRRDMVKRKTAQYLQHAEEIYTSHLQSQPEETGAMAQVDRGLSFGPPNISAAPLDELKKFRVLGVIGKVLLVLDPKSGDTFVIKGLRKSSHMSQIQKTVVVRGVPFLVHLIRYFSTEDSVFLLLRYAAGGRLWSHVSGFLNRSPEESVEFAREAGADAADSSRDSDGLRAGVTVLPIPQVATSSPGSSSEPPHAPLADIAEISKGSSYDEGSTSEEGEDEDEELDELEVKGDDHSLSTDSGEREYSNSYLSLFQDYQQEVGERATEAAALPVNAFFAATTGDGVESNSQCQETSGQSMSHLSSDSLCSPATLQEHVFFPPEGVSDIFSEALRSGDHLQDSKSSPMELFRIDSGDSGSDFPFVDKADGSEKTSAQSADGQDSGYTIEDVVAQNEKMMRMHDNLSVCVDIEAGDDKSDSASEVIPIISFREAAEEDTFSHGSGRSDLGTSYARPRPESAASGGQEALGASDLFATDPTALCTVDGAERSKQEDDRAERRAACGESDNRAANEAAPEESSTLVPGADRAVEAVVNAATDASGPVDETSLKADSDLYVVLDKGLGDTHDHPTEALVDKSAAAFGDTYASQGLPEGATPPLWLDPAFVEPETVTAAPAAAHRENLPVSRARRHVEDEEVDTSAVATRAREVSQVFRELEEARSRAVECRACLPEGCVRQWAAEIVVAVDGLHQHGLLCRDLNPSNILLDDRGHVLLTYFGRWSEVDRSCSSLALEQFYCAPEVGGIAEETEACDWWSLGAIMFELLTGKALHVCHPTGITTHTMLHLPQHLSPEASSLLRQLLQFNAWERLNVEEIRAHPFFSTVQWAKLTGR